MTYDQAIYSAFVTVCGNKFWELMLTITEEQMRTLLAAQRAGLPYEQVALTHTAQQLQLGRELNELWQRAEKIAEAAVGQAPVMLETTAPAPVLARAKTPSRSLAAQQPKHSAAHNQGSWDMQLMAVKKILGALQPNLDAVLGMLDDMAADSSRPGTSCAPGDEWVTAKESGLGVRHFRRAAKRGDIQAHRVGRQLVARRRDVDRYIEQQPVATKPESIPDSDPFDNALANGKLTPLKKDK